MVVRTINSAQECHFKTHERSKKQSGSATDLAPCAQHFNDVLTSFYAKRSIGDIGVLGVAKQRKVRQMIF